jgi:hypothetical protein
VVKKQLWFGGRGGGPIDETLPIMYISTKAAKKGAVQGSWTKQPPKSRFVFLDMSSTLLPKTNHKANINFQNPFSFVQYK